MSTQRDCPLVVVAGRVYPASLVTDERLVGGKAAGLLALPVPWVPPFFVFTHPFCQLIRTHGGARPAFGELSPNDRDSVNEFLAAPTGGGMSGMVLVRSNAPEEGIHARGTFYSVASTAAIDAVLNATDEVTGETPGEMCIIVQSAIQPGWIGHMSNERRVSERRSQWLIEGLDPGPTVTSGQVIHTTRSAKASTEQPLTARNQRELVHRLREVAAFLNDREPIRYHCEWVWDGRRVWIVQCDRAGVAIAPGEADAYLYMRGEVVPPFVPVSGMRPFGDEPDRWQKLKRPRLFRSLGFPVAEVFVITGDTWERDSSAGKPIERDLTEMCKLGSVVLRTDIAIDTVVSDVLLPNGPATRDPVELMRFGESVASYFRTKGVDAKDWALLPAFLYPAKASVMVHARPKAERVRVDALWGFPDGLSYFPHDSWFYYPTEHRAVERRRFKGRCLLPVGREWLSQSVGSPFDWESVLDEPEVATVSKWALRLADALGSEVQLMALVRLGGDRGAAACLPWHYTNWKVPRYATSLRMLPPASFVYEMRSRADLEKFRAGQVRKSVRGIYLRPESALLRDDMFLEEVGKLAGAANKAVFFEGSILGHAYYILARSGASVVPLNEAEPADSEKPYNKLVRDNIPLIIRRGGGLARVRQLPRETARRLLRHKLVEEAFEALTCTDDDLVEELADVLEVVDALCRFSGIDTTRLDSVRTEKRAKRGAFDTAVYLEATAIQPLQLLDDEQGLLPLADVDDTAPVAHRRSALLQVVREAPAGSGERARIAISLIPPAFGEPPPSVESRGLGCAVSVQYEGNEVNLVVWEPQMVAPPEQLLLFEEATSIDELGTE